MFLRYRLHQLADGEGRGMFDEVICGDCGESLVLDDGDEAQRCPACGADREHLFPADDTN
ncbi:hypothetical protein JCM17961_31490 [Endothiovibrio diazotrophicus]